METKGFRRFVKINPVLTPSMSDSTPDLDAQPPVWYTLH